VKSGDLPLSGRIWWHVGVSAAVGALAVTVAEVGVVGLVFGGVEQAVIMAAVAFGLFAAIGYAFLGAGRGWKQGFTVLVWVPIVVWAFVGGSGENVLEGTEPLTHVVGAAVAGIVALLMHEGWPRRAAAAVAAVAVVTTAVTSIHHHHVEDRKAAIVAFGSTMRPWVIGLDGYRQHGDPTVVSPKILRTSYYRPEQSDRPDLELTITTDASTTVVCGDVLRATMQADFEQPERTCRQSDGIWRRTSKDGHEVAIVKGNRIVRVAASDAVPEQSLIEALRSVRPMSDRYYRHALFGEAGEYIPALDGRR
jgi:hypothetical protein